MEAEVCAAGFDAGSFDVCSCAGNDNDITTAASPGAKSEAVIDEKFLECNTVYYVACDEYFPVSYRPYSR